MITTYEVRGEVMLGCIRAGAAVEDWNGEAISLPCRSAILFTHIGEPAREGA